MVDLFSWVPPTKDPRFVIPVSGRKVRSWTDQELDSLWRPYRSFVGPVEPPMVRVLREEAIAGNHRLTV